MKLIIAVIQPDELPKIKEEFLKRKIYKFTVTNAKGQGVEYPLQEVNIAKTAPAAAARVVFTAINMTAFVLSVPTIAN
jgi:nitrogen regulatory protein PII